MTKEHNPYDQPASTIGKIKKDPRELIMAAKPIVYLELTEPVLAQIMSHLTNLSEEDRALMEGLKQIKVVSDPRALLLEGCQVDELVKVLDYLADEQEHYQEEVEAAESQVNDHIWLAVQRLHNALIPPLPQEWVSPSALLEALEEDKCVGEIVEVEAHKSDVVRLDFGETADRPAMPRVKVIITCVEYSRDSDVVFWSNNLEDGEEVVITRSDTVKHIPHVCQPK